MSTSADAISRNTASRPAGFFRSSTMLRLLRLVLRNTGPMPGRTDQAGDVSVRRFHLDDIGAIITEHLGRVRPHQHGGHVDDLDALKWSHGSVRSWLICGTVDATVRGHVTSGRLEDQGFPAYGRMRERGHVGHACHSRRAMRPSYTRKFRPEGAARP